MLTFLPGVIALDNNRPLRGRFCPTNQLPQKLCLGTDLGGDAFLHESEQGVGWLWRSTVQAAKGRSFR